MTAAETKKMSIVMCEMMHQNGFKIGAFPSGTSMCC